MSNQVQRLWISQGGRVACDGHGGHYLEEATAARPDSAHHTTPLDDWIAVTPSDADGLACEECGRGWSR